MKIGTGAGVVAIRESPIDCLRSDVQQAQTLVNEQQNRVEKLQAQYMAGLDKMLAEDLQAAKSVIVLSQDRLEVYRASLATKRAVLDVALGQQAQQDDQNRLASEFQIATGRLDAARQSIEKLKELQRALPVQMADAEREFRHALQNWNERKAARDATKGQHRSNGTH